MSYEIVKSTKFVHRIVISTRLKSKVFSLEILILLIWTNVPRTNVAWTNVVVTVVIC